MKICRYVLVDSDNEEESWLYDTYKEAVKAAGNTHAVVEYEFEYVDSSLVYTPNGDSVWPSK